MKHYFSLIFLLSGIVASAQEEITIASLLSEMTSRTQLSHFPKTPFLTKHISSYDRSSKANTEDNWFHNWDMNQWESVAQTANGKEYVLMDVSEPGVITHFWMTGSGENRGQGTLRIYIDGKKEPVVSQTIRSFVGQNEAIGYPLSSSVSPKTKADERGHNLYLPIPYAKSCKITYQSDLIIPEGNPWETKSEILYYNIDYRAYQQKVSIESFTPQSIAKYKTQIDQTNQQLLNGHFNAELAPLEASTFNISLAPGQEMLIAQKDVGAAVEALNMRLKEDNPTQSLRSIILKCTFDDQQTVWAPIGDFFGAGYRIDAYETRYNKVALDGNLMAKWIMPFKNSCKISLENVGQTTVGVQGSVGFAAYNWDALSMHFYASWHQYTGVDTGASKSMLGGKGIQDLNFVTLSGKGVYVGDVLTLFNDNKPKDKATWTKEDGSFWYCWWGEGDEKIYIDGEQFPSHFGTGTEDYYCYAWCRPEKFAHPFVAQPSGEGNITPGYTVNTRVRGLDVLPFTSSLKFDMELWHWNKATVNYAPTTLYYMLPGGRTNIKADYKGAKEKVLLDYEALHKVE